MSVQSQINRIKSNLTAAYTAAQSKGATMPSSQNSANLAETINSISANQAVDYVVEQRISLGEAGSSTSNWGYRKWDSGRAECWLRRPINNMPCNTAVGNWFRTATIDFPKFPFTFSYYPIVNMHFETMSGTGGVVWSTGTSSATPTTKPINVYIIRMSSSAEITGWINIYAVGRWK